MSFKNIWGKTRKYVENTVEECKWWTIDLIKNKNVKKSHMEI